MNKEEYIDIKYVFETLRSNEFKEKYLGFFRNIFYRSDLYDYKFLIDDNTHGILELYTRNKDENIFLKVYKHDGFLNIDEHVESSIEDKENLGEMCEHLYVLVFSQYYELPYYKKYILNVKPDKIYNENIEMCFLFIDLLPFKLSDFKDKEHKTNVVS